MYLLSVIEMSLLLHKCDAVSVVHSIWHYSEVLVATLPLPSHTTFSFWKKSMALILHLNAQLFIEIYNYVASFSSS